MNDYELRRVIDFIDRTREQFQRAVPFAEPDGTWNIIAHAMRERLVGRPVTISSLVQVSGLPYGTASRRVHQLITNGALINDRVAGSSGRGLITPSPALIERFDTYSRVVLLELERTLRGDARGDLDDSYFGGQHQWNAITEAQFDAVKAIPGASAIRFLFHHDYYFMSIRHMWSDFRRKIGPATNFDNRDLEGLYAEIVENALRPESRYDIVALSAPWVAELSAQGALKPLDDRLAAGAVTAESFNSRIWSLGQWDGRQYGVPAYASVELLAIRRDLFDEQAIEAPDTFDDVIRAGRAFHDPGRGRYGISWHAGRGIPIARTFLFLIGCCGAPLFDLSEVSHGFPIEHLSARKLCALIDSYSSQIALQYMHRLREISPPDILTCDGEAALQYFVTGRTAMAYQGSIHASRGEIHIRSMVRRRISYLDIPSGARARTKTPLGGFLLAIPANVPPARANAAFDVIAWMSSPDAMQRRARHGLPISSFFSLCGDPEGAALSPIYALVDRLARADRLRVWRRPGGLDYMRAEQILGEEIHDAMQGLKADKEAIAAARSRIAALEREPA